MKLVGIQKNVEFSYNGTPFKGLNLYVTYPSTKVEGLATNKFFCNQEKPIFQDALKLKLGDEIDFTYNRFGKPETVFVITN